MNSYSNTLIIEKTLSLLKANGFSNIKPLENKQNLSDTTGTQALSILSPIVVSNLGESNNYYIVPLDGNLSAEFNDYIFVAINTELDELIEITTVSVSPPILNESKARQILKRIFNRNTIELSTGYFWALSKMLPSRFSIARKFVLDGQEMFLLSDNTIVSSLITDTINRGG